MKKAFLLVTLTFSCIASQIEEKLQFPSCQKLTFEQGSSSSCAHPIFTYQNLNDAYFEKLRSTFKLDAVVASCKTELEKVLTITHWVHNLWEHNSDNIPAQADAYSILVDVINHKKQFRCVEYSIVIAGCLNALGIPSKILSLKTADVQTREYGAGHVITESYLASLNKWIMIDGQVNVIPTLHVQPLNAIELQAALAQKNSGLNILSHAPAATLQEYVNFIGEYLYYFQTTCKPHHMYDKDQESVMLVPIGAEKPTVFQKTNPLKNVSYTHSIDCFYQKIK